MAGGREAAWRGPMRDVAHGFETTRRAVETVSSTFPDAVEERISFRGEETIRIAAGRLVEICRFLKGAEEFCYNVLTDIMASHWLDRDYEFEVSYLLMSLPNNALLRLKVRAGGSAAPAGIPTVTGVWETADWHEREEWDKVGVIFEGHPNLKRILLPDDWEGHPLRKDYPMEGIGA